MYLGNGHVTKMCLPHIKKLRLADYDTFAPLLQLLRHVLIDGNLRQATWKVDSWPIWHSVSNASEKGIHPRDSFRCSLERCPNNLLDDALVSFQEERPDIVKVGLADA